MAKNEKPGDLMGYEALQQEALRGVVRGALKRVAQRGLPGDHHFYISFRTDAAGAGLPAELLERYPEEMTIVLQNQFCDLSPADAHFSVTLQFGGQAEDLASIPYAAVTRFWDPSVQFLLALTPSATSEPEATSAPSATQGKTGEAPKIVSLDQFRKK